MSFVLFVARQRKGNAITVKHCLFKKCYRNEKKNIGCFFSTL